MAKKNESAFNKKMVIIVALGALILFAMLMVYTYGYNRKDTAVEYPSGELASSAGGTVYEVDSEVFPYAYNFVDIPYSVGVPDKGMLYVEGGYVYSYDSKGLLVAEVAKERTLMSYTQDVYSSLYATKEQPEVKECVSEQGYLNGYGATYGFYEISLKDIDKTVYQLAYLLDVGTEKVLLLMNTEEKDSEVFVGMRDFLVTMSRSLVNTEAASNASQTEVEPRTQGEGMDVDADEDPDAVTREAAIVAELDYEELFLTFCYMDVTAVPREVYVLDKDGNRYNSVEMAAGSVSFVIPDVSEGDELTLVVTSENLKGTTVEQMEYSEHLKELEAQEEGTLHVEEDMELLEETEE